MKRVHIFFLVAFLAFVSVLHAEKTAAPPVKENTAVIPQCRIDEWWFTRQPEKIGIMSKCDVDLLMIGDSITHGFEQIVELNSFLPDLLKGMKNVKLLGYRSELSR